MVFFETYSRRQPDRDEIEDEEEEVEDEEDEEEEDEAPRVPVEEEDMEEQPPLNIKQYLNFSGEDSQFSDFTFIIGRHHRKFHVEKGILIRHSPILKEMIVDIETITLLDVEETAFQRFLEVIYGASYVLNEDNIEKVLKLVKRWQAPFARRVCEDFVHNCRVMDRIKKLKLCVLYELNELGLKALIVRSFVSFEEIMDLRSSKILSGDAEMMRLMFDRVMALRNEARRHEMLIQNNNAPAPRAPIPPPENQENFRENQSSSSNDDIEHGRAPAPPPYQELAQPAPPVDFIEIRRNLNGFMASGSTNKRSGDHQEPAGGAKRPRKGIIDFSVGDSNLTDVVLVVEDQKFHVLKGRLAFHSQPFYTMFYGTYREAEQQEIELTGFGAEEFQVFLEYLYGDCGCRCDIVSGEIAQKALVIADMYDVDLVRRRCETTITKSSSLTKKMKFEIAVKYRLENLKGTILGEVKTFVDLEAILPSDLADLDPPTMKVVLEKSLEFNRCSKAPSPVPVPAALPRAAAVPVAAAPVRRAPGQAGPAPPVPVQPAAPVDLNRRPRRQRQAQRAQNRAPQ
ncbi:hypothetical protein CRE_14607 [Caenorhabditis remanei]|uniref:BTB domain-containing protein n=1 Tax=Caenorhabditis remanei TaxID=31234 RepID=E3M924_CAERE|nr:hypothetical protein CRE_14607 [Caenorhabditis remanei]